MDKPWKNNERKIAAYIGGERVPVSGRARGYAPDIKHPWLSIEVKLRMRVPAWIKNGMDQAKQSVRGDQIPCLIIREKFQRVDDALVCISLKDFRESILDDD